jgi:hypothetical protein
MRSIVFLVLRTESLVLRRKDKGKSWKELHYAAAEFSPWIDDWIGTMEESWVEWRKDKGKSWKELHHAAAVFSSWIYDRINSKENWKQENIDVERISIGTSITFVTNRKWNQKVIYGE